MSRWINFLADLLSGRVNNTLVSLTTRLRRQERRMTENEQIIRNAAQGINNAANSLDEGITSLLAKLDDLGVNREDLSDELALLSDATTHLQNVAGRLTPSTGGSAQADSGESTGPVATPITHEDIPPTPLAGSSGPTDAGVPVETQAPGQPNLDPMTTPTVEDATGESGTGESTSFDEPEALPETEGEVGFTTDGDPIEGFHTDSDEAPPESEETDDSFESASDGTGDEGETEESVPPSTGTQMGDQPSSGSPTNVHGDVDESEDFED